MNSAPEQHVTSIMSDPDEEAWALVKKKGMKKGKALELLRIEASLGKLNVVKSAKFSAAIVMEVEVKRASKEGKTAIT